MVANRFLAAAVLWFMSFSQPSAAAEANAPKGAKTQPASWIDDGISDPRHGGAQVSVPRNLDGLVLFGLHSSLNGLDNSANYSSAETGVGATVFIFSPAVPDGSIVAETSKNIILKRFGGGKIERDEGQTSGIRRIVIGGNGQTVNALAVARRGDWIVTVRATGSEYRRRDTLETFEKLVRFVLPNPPAAGAPDWKLPAPCKTEDKRADASIHRVLTPEALSLGILATAVPTNDAKLHMPWPAQHSTEYCLDSAAPGLPSVVLRGAPAREGGRSIGYLGLVADSGVMVEFGRFDDPAPAKPGPVLATLLMPDRVSVLQAYDDWPSRAQVDGLMTNLLEALKRPIVSATRDQVGPFSNIKVNIAEASPN